MIDSLHDSKTDDTWDRSIRFGYALTAFQGRFFQEENPGGFGIYICPCSSSPPERCGIRRFEMGEQS